MLVSAFATLGILLVIFVGVFVWLRLNENTIVFHPEKGDFIRPPPTSISIAGTSASKAPMVSRLSHV